MRNTYFITTIRNYPDDGRHLECHLPLPFDIKRGEDGYYYHDKRGKECKYNLFKSEGKVDDRWIVHLDKTENAVDGINPSLERIFHIMVDKDLDKIVDYCFEVYEKSLEMEKKRLEKLRKELGIEKKPKPQKTIGVIAYNLADFKLWSITKKHKPKGTKNTERVYTFKGVRYVGLTHPDHACGYTFDKILETGSMATLNRLYHSIVSLAEISLKTQKV